TAANSAANPISSRVVHWLPWNSGYTAGSLACSEFLIPLKVACLAVISAAVGRSLAAIAWDHSSCLPYWLTTVWVCVGDVAYTVVPSSPSSQGLQTRTDHSSFAFWSTSPFEELNA